MSLHIDNYHIMGTSLISRAALLNKQEDDRVMACTILFIDMVHCIVSEL